MSITRELISDALSFRFRELCGERISVIAPETFGDMASFVSRVRDELLNASPAEIKNRAQEMGAPVGWMISDTDCLSSLRTLSTGEHLQLHPGERPPLNSFLERFDASRQDCERRFQLLTERYSCPLNFSHSAEEDVRERVLTRLMVQDRSRIEKTSVEGNVNSDLLLRLNLTALHAARATDLRFLDALNYYYELLPFKWKSQSEHDWLLISYLALYARALAAWI